MTKIEPYTYDEWTRQEWELWQEIVKELKKLGIDINEQDRLYNLLNEWAWTYHLMKTEYRKRVKSPKTASPRAEF